MTRFRSGFIFTFVLAVVSQISPLYANNAVPVLIWGGAGSDSDSGRHSINPFLKTIRKEFESFLHEKLEGLPPVLLYVKQNLCVEDLKKHKQHLQPTITGDSVYYFPAVETAVNVIEDLPFYNTTYTDYTDSISEGQLSVMTISNLDTVPQTYETLKESNPNLTAILTGRLCSYRQSERVKRDVAEDDDSFVVQSDRVLLYSSQRLLMKIPEENNALVLSKKCTATETENGNELLLHLSWTGSEMDEHKAPIDKLTLSFKFESKTEGYYTLKTVNYQNNTKTSINNSLTTNMDIVFPNTFSYHCSRNVTFEKGDNYSLVIQDLQVQVFPDKDQAREPIFSDAYDCVGFTTIPIWTGIFVTTILGIIMMWGLTMIMDIRTMDRFDDPKGKTITISAQE
nr:uncharacterized protein LOC116431521 [Nomia melanderi]